MKKHRYFFFFIFVLLSLRSARATDAMNAEPVTSIVNGKPRFGDRFFLRSVLMHVFGPSAKPVVSEYIFNNGQVFGGPCDEYEQIRIGPSSFDLANPESFCPGSKVGSRLSQIPSENVIRLGYMYRTCDELTANPVALAFAVKKIGRVAAAPVEEDFFKIIKQFNPTAAVSEKDKSVFAKLRQDKKYQKLSSQKQWQLLFRLTCKSTDWQTL